MQRKPAVAGQFYGGTQSECLAEICECLPVEPINETLPDKIVAGIVPHAGWVFSGCLAAKTFAAIKEVNETVDTFIIFGAAHSHFGRKAVAYNEGTWLTPLGDIAIDTELAEQILSLGAEADPSAHIGEHSIEVQIPFIQHMFPDAQIVPVIMPVAGFDHTFGIKIGQLLAQKPEKTIVAIGSTDLTHYGPRYGFCPMGTGPEALKWAREVNDMEFIKLAVEMHEEDLLKTAVKNGSACGPAAVATTIAVAKGAGAIHGILLGHTTSWDVMKEKFHQSSEESVGYASIVY